MVDGMHVLPRELVISESFHQNHIALHIYGGYASMDSRHFLRYQRRCRYMFRPDPGSMQIMRTNKNQSKQRPQLLTGSTAYGDAGCFPVPATRYFRHPSLQECRRFASHSTTPFPEALFVCRMHEGLSFVVSVLRDSGMRIWT